MGFLDDVIRWFSDPWGSTGLQNPPVSVDNNPTSSNTEPSNWPGKWLAALGIVTMGVASAPALYTLYKGQNSGKKGRWTDKDERAYLALESASNRNVTLLASLAPAFAMPIAYITVEALEQRKYIPGPLGDAVQGLMVAGAIAPALGNILGSVVTLGTKAAKK